MMKDYGKSEDLSYIDEAKYSSVSNMANVNLSMKNILKNYYGIDVYYGDSTEAMAESVNATKITDKKEIFEMLKEINTALAKYPKNIIGEIEAKGYRVSVYLVSSFSNSNIAIANRNSVGEFNIYISYSSGLERTFHHETYHILDYYIKLESDESLVYNEWKEYNPKNFKYTANTNKISSNYVYKSGRSGSYFVSTYAKYSEKEDRAETFAQMMTDTKKEIYYNEGEAIKGKMNIIENVLNSTFSVVNESKNIYWLRFLAKE